MQSVSLQNVRKLPVIEKLFIINGTFYLFFHSMILREFGDVKTQTCQIMVTMDLCNHTLMLRDFDFIKNIDFAILIE